jgi:hypothetical protein
VAFQGVPPMNPGGCQCYRSGSDDGKRPGAATL